MATNSPAMSRTRLLVGLDVADLDALEHRVAQRCSTGTESQTNSILSFLNARSCMIFDARSSSRRWIDVDLRGELGEEGRLLEGGVAPADHGDRLVLEEEAVAGGAGRDAVADELASRWSRPEHLGLGAGGHDDGPGLVVGHVAHLDVEGARREVDPVTFSVRNSAPKRAAWARKLAISSGPMMPVDEAGVVLHLGGEHELAAGLVAGGRRARPRSPAGRRLARAA